MTDFERQMHLLGERMAESQTNWERYRIESRKDWERSLAESREKRERDMADWKVRMDKLDRSIDKASEQIAETNRTVDRVSEQIAETGRSVDRVSEQIAETGRSVDRVSEQIAETGRSVDKVTKQMGGIENNIGHHAEEYFQNIFAERMAFGGVEYDDMTPNLAHREKNGEVEFDIFLENGDAVAIIEVKNRIHPKFIKELAEERLQKFRRYFPGYNNHRAYLGIAGFSFSKTVLKEAKKYGVGIIRQVGDSVEMDACELKAY